LIRRIRVHWPATQITIRGDSHNGRPEVMAWCEDNGIDYMFGLAPAKPLAAKVEEAADAVQAEKSADAVAALLRQNTPPSPGTSGAALPPVSR
jgi:hypothetical protein